MRGTRVLPSMRLFPKGFRLKVQAVGQVLIRILDVPRGILAGGRSLNPISP